MSKNTHSYLPLQKYHILPIYGISPELIKNLLKIVLEIEKKFLTVLC